MGGIALTPQQERGDALRRLGVRFRSGDSTERRLDDLAKIDKRGVDTVDLLEAVERIEFTRQVNTYPPLAEILGRCGEARVARLRASQKQVEPHSGGPATAAERVHMRDMLLLYRAGLIWCDVCVCYGKFCREHCDTDGRGPTARQTANAVAALDPAVRESAAQPRSKVGRRRIARKPSPQEQIHIDAVAEGVRLRAAQGVVASSKPSSLTPLSDIEPF